jgi:DnaJ-class molecular chaperone
VPTLTGDVVLKIRPGTQPGQTQVLRGKGIKMLDSNRYGDQYVHINVIIPVYVLCSFSNFYCEFFLGNLFVFCFSFCAQVFLIFLFCIFA